MNCNNNKSPWNFQFLNKEKNLELLKHFGGERTGYVQAGAKKYFFPIKFSEDGDKYYYFKPRQTDTWIVSFPRSGTTWTQEMVWLLANDLNFQEAKEVTLMERFPFLEFSSCVHKDVFNEFMGKIENEYLKTELQKACNSAIEVLNEIKGNRFIKTHLPFSLLPPDLLKCGAKVIYVARNPKDVAVSFYNFHQFIKTLDFKGDFKTFWNYFEENMIQWTPYWEHITEAWQLRNNSNLLFLFYENLKKDLGNNLKLISKFLNVQYSESQMAKLIEHLDFKNFQNNRSVNMEVLRDLGMLSDNNQKCIRKGKSGSWEEMFSPELNYQADRWIEKNLENTDLRFPDLF